MLRIVVCILNSAHLLHPRFNYYNLMLNNYLSSMSTEMSANVSVLFVPDFVRICLIRMFYYGCMH